MNGVQTNNDCNNCSQHCIKDIFQSDDLEKINNNKIAINFKAGERILRQGGFVAQFAYIKEGAVKKVIEGKNNRNTILKIINPGEFIALSLIGNPDVYPFSVFALTDCALCYLRKETFIELVTKSEKANKFLLQWNAKNHIELYDKINVSATRNSHGKLAYSLMLLAKQNFQDDIFKYISRKDLAELSSISLESVNKILLQLKNDGIISIDAEGLKIERLDLIERLSTVG